MERWRTSFINLEQSIQDVAHGLFVSGELVSKSGIYRAEHTGGICASEAVMVRGSRLPLCSECHQPLFFRLKKPVPHLSEDEDFGGEMIMN